LNQRKLKKTKTTNMIQDPTGNQHMIFTLYNRFNSPAYIII